MTEQEALSLIDTLLQGASRELKLSDVQSRVFVGAWVGLPYQAIADRLGYEPDYIKQVGSQLWRLLSEAVGEEVSKKNLQTVLRRYQQAQGEVREQPEWAEPVDVSRFYGRQAELQTLTNWVIGNAALEEQRCRVIGIFGLGGMGKTSLSVKLAQQVQAEFDCVIWRSLREAPPLSLLLSQVLPVIAGSATTADCSMTSLMEQLRQKRCLLVIDNIESILRSSAEQQPMRGGQFQANYEEYGQLFAQIADQPHQSCLILTGREKPTGLSEREKRDLSVRSLQLSGLVGEAGEQVLIAKGLEASEQQRQILVNYFYGNPLALKIVATTIQNLFGGDCQTFLAQGSSVFGNLWNLLEEQFQRLAPLPQQIMYWLAINREWVEPVKLKNEIEPQVSWPQFLEGLELLYERSLIETGEAGITQQSVIMEYVTERLLQTVLKEITTGDLQLFRTHALIEAQTQDYVRETQVQLILNPLINRLLTRFASQPELEQHLGQLLVKLRHQTALQTGYAVGNLLNLFCYLNTDLTGFDFSDLVIRQAYLANASLPQVNLTGAEISQTVFAETFGGVASVAFSPDGQRLASSDTRGEIQIWDAQTGVQRVLCQGHQHWTWAIAFSPNSQYLASASDDYRVKLWDAETGRCLQTYSGHTCAVNDVAFSPDGQTIATCSQDTTIRLWRVAVGNPQPEVQTLVTNEKRVWGIAFSPDGQTLASGGQDCCIRLWDLATGICRAVWPAHDYWVKSVAFSPDGKYLASCSFDQTIKLWQLDTQACLQTWRGHRQPVTEIAFSPDGQQIASSSFDRTLKVWDLSTGECLQTMIGHASRVWTVAYHPNGQQIASGGDDHATKLWSLKTGRCTKSITGHANAPLSLALDCNYLASGHEDQTVRVWDLQTGTILQTLPGHTNRVWSVAWQPGSTLLASSSADHTIKLWNWRSGSCLQTLLGHTSWVWTVVFSPDGRQLASCSYDQTLKIWDIGTGQCLKTLQEHPSPIISVAYSPDGRWLASSGFDGMIKLWDAQTGECCQTLTEHTNSTWSVTFSPDGEWLLSASYDQTLKLWSVSTGECLQTFQGHDRPVMAAQFCLGGKSIVSSGFDGTLKLWDVATGKCKQTLTGHTELVCTLVAASIQLGDRDTAIAISGSLDESIKLWDLQAHKCWQTLRVPRPYEGMKIQGIQGLTEGQEMTLKALGAIG
jgi:WD40 repeat protein